VSGPAFIAEVIAAEGGRVTFARFMELALTHPTLGYYSCVGRVLGRRGDFSTGPALSPFFNRTLARLMTELLDASLSAGAGDPASGARPSVVELGGGEGQLAAAVLGYWAAERPEFRERVAYRILDVGAPLRARQAEAVAEPAAVGWDVGWGGTLEEACAGTRPVVMVGNEFLDTVPVHLVRVGGPEPSEAYVDATPAGGLEQSWGPLSEPAAAEVEALFGAAPPQPLESLTADGFIEVFPALGGLLGEIARLMPAGSLLSVDYGEWFPGVRKEGERWGLEDRLPRRRTVRSYFKHQLEFDPLARPGKQDLTADVDFAAVDLHGRLAGFQTLLFTTLGAFLAAGGAERELEALEGGGSGPDGLGDDVLEADRQATILRMLMDQDDLGAAFKVMVQVRDVG
jgi:SAM-dependent MidA family methyltransferase